MKNIKLLEKFLEEARDSAYVSIRANFMLNLEFSDYTEEIRMLSGLIEYISILIKIPNITEMEILKEIEDKIAFLKLIYSSNKKIFSKSIEIITFISTLKEED